MPFENYFIILFKSENSDEFIQKDKWCPYDDMQDVILKIIGNYDEILDNYGIHTIIYNKN